MSERKQHWWAATARHHRRGVLTATGVITGLALVSAVVWATPEGPVAQTAVGAARAIGDGTVDLQNANVRLAAKIAGLRKEVATRDRALSSAYRVGHTAATPTPTADTPTTASVAGAAAAAAAAAARSTASARPGPSSRPTTGSALRPAPTGRPVAKPAPAPSAKPSSRPTARPTAKPTTVPSPKPTTAPAVRITPAPLPRPTVTVTAAPKPVQTTAPKPVQTSAPKPSPTPTTAPVPAGPVAPSRSDLLASSRRTFGLYTEQAPFSWSTYDDAAAKLTTAPTTVGYFSGWDEEFRANAVTRAWSKGVLPVMTWESRPIDAKNNVVDEPEYSLPRIIDGDFDDYLRTYARSVVATGLPLAIRVDHEMNGTWYPWAEDDGHGRAINGNRPGDYVKMWRHVHDVFQQEGANDYVIWLWSPNRVNRLTGAHKTVDYTRSLYPGDDYVDWVGLSGYLRPAYDAADDFSFDYTYGRTLDQLRAIAPGKRILLAEIGASETGGHKVAWLNSMFDALADPRNSDITGVIWFDLAVSTYTEGQLGTNDWRVDSRPETLDAFRTGLARTDEGFGPLPSPAPAP